MTRISEMIPKFEMEMRVGFKFLRLPTLFLKAFATKPYVDPHLHRYRSQSNGCAVEGAES